jgi:putative transposase
LLKSELLYLQNFDSIGHFIDELHKYILYYNNDRIIVEPIDNRLKE